MGLLLLAFMFRQESEVRSKWWNCLDYGNWTALRDSSAWVLAVTLKKFGTQTGDSFDVPTPQPKGQRVLCSLPWMSVNV